MPAPGGEGEAGGGRGREGAAGCRRARRRVAAAAMEGRGPEEAARGGCWSRGEENEGARVQPFRVQNAWVNPVPFSIFHRLTRPVFNKFFSRNFQKRDTIHPILSSFSSWIGSVFEKSDIDLAVTISIPNYKSFLVFLDT